MRIISYIFLIIVIVLGITFATLNSQTVTINYYVGHRELPLSLLLVSIFAAGCIVGLIVSSWAVLKNKIKNRRLRKRLELADKEIENLRAIPLKDQH